MLEMKANKSEAGVHMIRFLFSPYGRISRKSVWLHWMLPYIGVMIVATILDFASFPADPATGEPPPVFQGIVSLALLWPGIAVTTKRLHDLGWSGWWQILMLVGIVALAVTAYFYLGTSDTASAPSAPLDPIAMNALLVLSIGLGLFALYLSILTLFVRGQPGPNKYGEDPLSAA